MQLGVWCIEGSASRIRGLKKSVSNRVTLNRVLRALL